ncbi:hypothetical protein AKO1_001101 [Acrasis kona]|uniref:Uncharacterized protein n=1 Tax=Acrasis kona TaxID=1008807 RepID=A0AAW2ZD74_9EUKA
MFGVQKNHNSTSKHKRAQDIDSEEFDEMDRLIKLSSNSTNGVQKNDKSGQCFSIERLMTFFVSTFASPNQQVRKAAVDCVVEVYKLAGDRIRSYLRETQNSFLLQEIKQKVVKEARIQQNSRINSAPMNRLSSIVQPLGMADQHDDVTGMNRPQSFDVVSSMGNPMFGNSLGGGRLGAGRRWTGVNEGNVVSSTLPGTPSTPSTGFSTQSSVKKGKNNRFIFN